MPGHTPCIVCDSPNVFRVVEIPPLPIDTNRLWVSRADARAAPKARLILAHCNNCGHLFNCNYDDDLVTYEVDYENSQIFSPRFRRYAEELADSLIARHDLRRKHIVEIGGGTGDFLRIICDRGDNLGVSIGPSYSAGKDRPSNVRFIKDYYTAKYVDEPADIIICRHVLEHFWGVRDLVTTVREAADKRRDMAVYFEVPNGDFIFRERAFWEFHYQHVSYFTKASLTKLFTRCGFEVREVQELFEGRFLGIEVCAAAHDVAPNQSQSCEANGEQMTAVSCRSFGAACDTRFVRWQDQVKLLCGNGQRVLAWGAGAKAVTFLNIVDPAGDCITHIVDVSPRKTGRYVPGSGQEIVEPSALRELSPDVLILMNAVYRDEIRAAVRALGLDPIFLVA